MGDLGIALGIGGGTGLALIAGLGFLAGFWKAKRDLLLLKEHQQQGAMEALSKPSPRGSDLVSKL